MTPPYGHLYYRDPRTLRIARATATEAVLLERIGVLWSYRAWYRQQSRQDVWAGLALRSEVELRALVAVARRARRQVVADLVPLRSSWAGETELELRSSWGDR